MKGATLLATLQFLGIMPSFSRPRVYDDNPYSEALFRTLKYRPEYPTLPFQSLQEAQCWVQGFVSWYNTEHRHSGIRFVTPELRHAGQESRVLARRKEVYEEAKRRNPSRWTRATRNWSPIAEVSLNPAPRQQEVLQRVSA
jgi:putative transposase